LKTKNSKWEKLVINKKRIIRKKLGLSFHLTKNYQIKNEKEKKFEEEEWIIS
jgi:hypothetical protein